MPAPDWRKLLGDADALTKYLESDIAKRKEIEDDYPQLSNVDNQSWTPLHFAVFYNRSDILKILLKYKPDVNVKIMARERDRDMGSLWSTFSVTPLHMAIKGGYEELIDILLQAGASTNIGYSKLYLCSCCSYWRSDDYLTCKDLAPKDCPYLHKLERNFTPQSLQQICLSKVNNLYYHHKSWQKPIPASLKSAGNILPQDLIVKIPYLYGPIEKERKRLEQLELDERKKKEEMEYEQLFVDLSSVNAPLSDKGGKFIKATQLLAAVESKSKALLFLQPLESFVHDKEFPQVFGISKAEFQALPKWKQTNIKKSRKMF